MKCRLCGCSDFEACVIDGIACSWAEPGLCTFCADDRIRAAVDAMSAPLVELYSEGEASEFLRSRAAGGAL